MTDTTFIPRTTTIVSTWLQDVNDVVYRSTPPPDAPARPLSEKLADLPVTPQDYADYDGVGTGAVDDTAAINAAVASGRNVYFGDCDKVYLVSAPIQGMRDGQMLYGDNPTILLNGAIPAFDFQGLTSNYLQSNAVSGLRFSGDALGTGIQARFTEFLRIENCTFTGGLRGIMLAPLLTEQVSKGWITKCTFDGCTYGIFGVTRVLDYDITANVFLDCTSAAIYINTMDGGAIHRNKVSSALGAGTENLGIYAGVPTGASISYNFVTGVNGAGIQVSSPRRTSIDHNVLFQTGQSSRAAGLHFIEGGVVSVQNDISSNMLYQCYGHGIQATAMSLQLSYIDKNLIYEAGYTDVTKSRDAIAMLSAVSVRLSRNVIDGAANQTRYWLDIADCSVALDDNGFGGTLNPDLARDATCALNIAPRSGPTIVTVTSTVTYTDFLIVGTGGGGGITINLPSAANVGKEYMIIKGDVGAGAVTIDPAGAETINGAATKVLAAQYNKVRLMSDGTNWLEV